MPNFFILPSNFNFGVFFVLDFEKPLEDFQNLAHFKKLAHVYVVKNACKLERNIIQRGWES
jgi:hypothetical protein